MTVRIFHSVLAISMAALIYNIPLNLFVGLPNIALVSAIAFFMIAGIYYSSRYLGKTDIARTFVCITGTVLFVANYFLNSGIDGPTGHFFLLLMVATVAIVPVKQYKYWIIGNVLIMIGLHTLQYHYPELVPYTYPNKIDRYIDYNSAYITVVIVIFTCFYIIRKSYDAALIKAEETSAALIELNAEKNKLFSILSHDLRSPLANIQGYLEVLTQTDIPEDDRRVLKAQLLKSTRNTLEMVNSVLHWSKSQMNGGAVKKQYLMAEEVLKSQIELASNIAGQKKITLSTQIQPQATIWANADMVQLIVRNLLNNAIKFTSMGGAIELKVTNSNESCLIAITDSGNGNPANLSPQIFELSMISAVGTNNETGVGLGLVLCRENTRALGGKIWFDCDKPSGATFFVELPATPS